MTGAERERLKRLVDEERRARIDADRVHGPKRNVDCFGCGGPVDSYTRGCRQCGDRRRGRAKRGGRSA